MRCAGCGFFDHAFDLFDFFHQMQLGRQAARGIRQHDVDITRARRGNRIENHRGRIAFFLADHRDLIALAPHLQLLARRGAKSVARGEQYRFALCLKQLGELADRRGLARAIHASQHQNKRPLRADHQRYLQGLQHLRQRLGQGAMQLRSFGKIFAAHALLQRFQ